MNKILVSSESSASLPSIEQKSRNKAALGAFDSG